MFSPRTIEDIQIDFFRQLAENNSSLTDISPGSILYTLGRSMAGVQSEQDLIYDEAAKNLFIKTATETGLDELAANYSLIRKPGQFATGYALAISNEGNYTLAPDSVLTDVQTGLQFLINEVSDLGLSSFIESRVAITSANKGKDYNLKAGAKLISNIYPSVLFIIGSHRTTSGQVCGDLRNGSDPESDELFRERLINFILNRRGTTEASIKAALLADPQVSWISFSNPLPGFLLIWLDSPETLTSQDLLRLNSLVNTARPAGVVIELKQATRQLVDINIYTLPKGGTDLDTLTKKLTGLVDSFLLSLALGQTFLRDDLIKTMAALPEVLQVSLLEPSANVVPTNDSTVLRSGLVRVTYNA